MTILNGVGGLAIEGVYKDGKYLGLIYIIYIYIYRYIFSRIFFFMLKWNGDISNILGLDSCFFSYPI